MRQVKRSRISQSVNLDLTVATPAKRGETASQPQIGPLAATQRNGFYLERAPNKVAALPHSTRLRGQSDAVGVNGLFS